MDATDKDCLAPYKFHGVDFRTTKNGQAIATCPYCAQDDSRTGEGHFFVSVKTGQYQCKKCGEEGNVYTFLTKLHQRLLAETTDAHLKALSKDRGGQPFDSFASHDVAFDEVGHRYLIPVPNGNGALANLLAYAPKSEKRKPLPTTGCALHLYGLPDLKDEGPIYLVEGPWKKQALCWLLEKVGLDQDLYSVLSTLGAGSFKKEWAEKFKDRDVILMYDNDQTGSTNMDKVSKLLAPVASSVRRIVWPASTEEKYGVNDFVADNRKTPKKAWRLLKSFVPEATTGSGKKARPKLVRKFFKDVLKDFRKATVHMSRTYEDVLTVVMAVVLSAQLDNSGLMSERSRIPLWLFLVGPPGVGKTLLIHSFLEAAEQSHFLSCLTKSQLVSGYSVGEGEEDPSILPKLRGKCLFVEDYTTIKSLPLGSQEELYGLLRSAYNGKFDQTFGNMQVRSYDDLYFSMVAGVTDVIHGDQRATLGERFLKIDVMGEDTDEMQLMRAALNPMLGRIDEKAAKAEKLLRESVAAFLSNPFDIEKLPDVPNWFIERLLSLASLGARLRAHVARQHGDLLYRPRAEVGTRLVKQLSKLARLVAYVLGKRTVDKEVYRIVHRVALDTMIGFNLEILHCLYSAKDGCILPDIGNALQISHSSIDRKLQDLQELGVVIREQSIRKDKRGRRYYIWRMAEHIKEFWKGADIQFTPPKTDRRKGYKPKSKVPLKRKKK